MGPGPGFVAVTLFCLAGAVPFALYRRPRKKERSLAARLQLRGLLICGTLLTVLLGFCMGAAQTLREAEIYFQPPLMAFSAQTTCGFRL